jgi:dynein heavy chain
MASEGNLLFFAVSDLANIDSMYQYSLTYFTDLFKMGIENSERSENVEMRLANLR